MTIFLIDGVRVPQRAYKARQIWGEYTGAKFTAYVHVQPKKPQPNQAN